MTFDSGVAPPARPKVLFQLSGSIAAYKACHVVSRLVQDGCEVQTVASRSALEFVGKATLEGLTGRPAATEVFAEGSYMDHIRLIRWADVAVLCPATANTLNRMAAGIGDDLITTLFLAHDFDKPYLVAPAMNVAMYRHPATRQSLQRLREWGVQILEPGSGSLACGEIGEGRLLEPELILEALTECLQGLASSRASDPPAAARAPHPAAERPLPDRLLPEEGRSPGSTSGAVRQAVSRPLRILVTSGGTIVPIDGVRSIANTSTGGTGAAIAEALAAVGHRITLVHARDALLPRTHKGTDAATLYPIRLVPFTTFSELDEVLRHELSTDSYDAVIHLAAVSDFGVDHLVVDGKTIVPNPLGKIDSGERLSIHLHRNHKILARLKDYSGAGETRGVVPVVVGFKLTNGASPAERLRAVEQITPGTDLIVHNDLTEIDGDQHAATIFAHGAELRRVTSKQELARFLGEFVAERVQQRERA